MRFVPALAEIAVGDVVVTSGLDQIYPKGLLVGHVSRIERPVGLLKDVYVRPAAQLDLQMVLILVGAPGTPDLTESVR
jgi:rod shape-determining protein MreC